MLEGWVSPDNTEAQDIWRRMSELREHFPELRSASLYRSGGTRRWNLQDMKSDLEIYQARKAAKDTGVGSGPVAAPAAQESEADTTTKARGSKRGAEERDTEAEGGTGPVAVPAARGP
eukprot:2778238-Amphidinium_carterae.1